MSSGQPTYGIVGVGAIAAAIVTGLCEGVAEPPPVVLSPRNAERAAGLVASLPSVRMATDNQGVVDASDVVVVCLLPADAGDVLAGLSFRSDQAVVSAVAGSGSPTWPSWLRRPPTSRAASRYQPSQRGKA